MIIEKISLNGFLSYIEEEVDFRPYHTLLISGLNGEGKSALIESIPFCFWGIGRGRTLSDYINDQCKTLKIEICFVMENVRYKKIRQYGKAGKVNELYIDKNSKELENCVWSLISDDTKRKTDELLTEILGLDYSIFSNSIFFGQKEASSFVDGDASERKELLCNLLGIQIYEKAEVIAKNEARDLDNKIQIKSIVLNDKFKIVEQKEKVEANLVYSNKTISEFNLQIDQINETLVKKRKSQESIKVKIANQEKDKQQLTEVLNLIVNTQNQQKEQNENISEKESELSELIDEGIDEVEKTQKIIDDSNEDDLLNKKNEHQKTIKEIESSKLKLPGIKTKLIAQRESKEKVLQQKTEIDTKIKALNEKKKKIDKSCAICPIIDEPCDKLSVESKNQLLEAIDMEISNFKNDLIKIEKQLLTIHENIVSLDGELESINKRINQETLITKKIIDIDKVIDSIKLAKENLPKIKIKYREKVDKLELEIEKLKNQLKVTEKSLNEFLVKKELIEKSLEKNLLIELNTVKSQIVTYENDLKEIVKSKNESSLLLGELNLKIKTILQAELDVKEIQREIDVLKEDFRINTELSILFGKNGLQKDIINDNVPLLEATTNELLSKFAKNSQLQVKFDLDPVNKSGELKKKGGLDVVIFEKGKLPRTLNMYSGGEVVRIVFAILLSLSNLLTQRAGKKSHTLIIDERIAALDQEGINQFIEIIKYISGQYKKIFVISHITELKEAFNDIIVASKDPENGSKIIY